MISTHFFKCADDLVAQFVNFLILQPFSKSSIWFHGFTLSRLISLLSPSSPCVRREQRMQFYTEFSRSWSVSNMDV